MTLVEARLISALQIIAEEFGMETTDPDVLSQRCPKSLAVLSELALGNGVRRITLGPDDHLVLRTATHLAPPQIEALKEAWGRHVKGNRPIVLMGGVEIDSVLTIEEQKPEQPEAELVKRCDAEVELRGIGTYRCERNDDHGGDEMAAEADDRHRTTWYDADKKPHVFKW